MHASPPTPRLGLRFFTRRPRITLRCVAHYRVAHYRRDVHASAAAHTWATCNSPSKVLSVHRTVHTTSNRSPFSHVAEQIQKYRPAPHSLRMDLESIASLSRNHICAGSCNPHLRELMQPMMHAQSCSLTFGAWQRLHQRRPAQPPKGSNQPPHMGTDRIQLPSVVSLKRLSKSSRSGCCSICCSPRPLAESYVT